MEESILEPVTSTKEGVQPRLSTSFEMILDGSKPETVTAYLFDHNIFIKQKVLPLLPRKTQRNLTTK